MKKPLLTLMFIAGIATLSIAAQAHGEPEFRQASCNGLAIGKNCSMNHEH